MVNEHNFSNIEDSKSDSEGRYYKENNYSGDKRQSFNQLSCTQCPCRIVCFAAIKSA